MCRCGCSINRKKTVCGKNTYYRYPSRDCSLSWHNSRPSRFDYIVNGSYAGRYGC